MKISINELVALLADRVGQPFNKSLQEELKVIINYKAASFFKRLLEKDPSQRKFFLKDFSAQLEKVDRADCPVEVGCDVLRTVEDIPTPLRSSFSLFDYVGTVDRLHAFSYSAPDQLRYLTHSKYTGNHPKYFYVDKKIYIYNNLDLQWINIRGVFSDPRELKPFKCDGEPCYSDNDQFDIPEDIINDIIRDTLSVELRNIFPEKDEVKVDEEETN